MKTLQKSDYEKIWKKMRQDFKNSYFLPKCYDWAIEGADVITESIIYSFTDMGRRWIQEVEDSVEPDLDDQLYGRDRMGEWFTELKIKEGRKQLGGKVAPTLSVPYYELFDKDLEVEVPKSMTLSEKWNYFESSRPNYHDGDLLEWEKANGITRDRDGNIFFSTKDSKNQMQEDSSSLGKENPVIKTNGDDDLLSRDEQIRVPEERTLKKGKDELPLCGNDISPLNVQDLSEESDLPF